MSTVFRVEKTANYMVMSNCHLKDRRFSYKAKGLLSEMLSLLLDWDYTQILIPLKNGHLFNHCTTPQNLSKGLKGIRIGGLAVIVKDGVDSVRTAVRELEKYSYFVRSQKRDERRCMSVNEYIVYENPEQNPNYVPANGKSLYGQDKPDNNRPTSPKHKL